jgi:hypothetical protein
MKTTYKSSSSILKGFLAIILLGLAYFTGIRTDSLSKQKTYSYFPSEQNMGSISLGYDIYIPKDTVQWYEPEPNPGDKSQLNQFYVIDPQISDLKEQKIIEGEFYNASVRDNKITEIEQALPKNGNWQMLGTVADGKVSRQAYMVDNGVTTDYYYSTYTKTSGIYILKISVHKSYLQKYKDIIDKILLSVDVL